jgi:hypothetical protein
MPSHKGQHQVAAALQLKHVPNKNTQNGIEEDSDGNRNDNSQDEETHEDGEEHGVQRKSSRLQKTTPTKTLRQNVFDDDTEGFRNENTHDDETAEAGQKRAHGHAHNSGKSNTTQGGDDRSSEDGDQRGVQRKSSRLNKQLLLNP